MIDPLAIETQGLRRSYRSQVVLDGIDLSVPRGAVFALLGPNGAGKTTTVRILATLLAPDGGSARVAGHDVVAERRAVRRRISLTGQYAALDDVQTGAENLEMVARLVGLTGRRARARASELLARFDLADAAGRRVSTYSGGMRRRLDLACGLVSDPSVIVLDEPTTGLDPRSRQAMWEVVAGLAADGVTTFLTTQYLEEADRLADRIAVLDEGRIVAEGSAEELKRAVGSDRLDVRVTDAEVFARYAERLGARLVASDPAALTLGIATGGGAGEIRALLDELDPGREFVERFAVQRATLDDVFMTLTGPRNPHRESELTHA